MSDGQRRQRTRARVFDAARALLVDEGATSLTFSSVAERSGIARKTLYAHWTSLADLLADLLLDAHAEPIPLPTDADEQLKVEAFRRDVETGLRDPALGGAISYLIAAADSDSKAREVLDGLSKSRAGQLANLLGRPVSVDDLAEVVGPAFFLIMVARK